MEVPTDYFAWCHRLQCPPNACNDTVKKILCKGLIELLWDDIANVTFPADEVLETRKNILLYKLKHGIPDRIIQCMTSMARLKSEQGEMVTEISRLEEEYERQDFAVRQKVQKLREIKAKRAIARARKELFRMKQSQTSTQLRDCADMRLVCQHLMPNTLKDLNPKETREILDVVKNLCTGANKKQIWDQVSNALGGVDTSVLWQHLYQHLSEDVDKLIKLEAQKITESRSLEDNIDIGIAKICGQHVCSVSKRLLHDARASKYQQGVLEFIEKIELASTNTDVSEWLALALEVRKLEVEQCGMQKEVDKIQEEIQENSNLIFELLQLTSDIQSIDVEMEEYVKDVQQSLYFLRSAPMSITKMKEKLYTELQKIVAIRSGEYDSTWLKNDLNTEVDMFYDTLDLNAVRKVMLKGDIGTYRHTKCCITEACVSITSAHGVNLMPYFPMIQIPIYSLVECYKNLVRMLFYKKFDSLSIEENLDSIQTPIVMPVRNDYNTLDLLDLSNVVCERARKEIDEFNEIMNAWVNQTVQKVMEIEKKTVEDATYTEWMHRYSLLLYMIQNTA